MATVAKSKTALIRGPGVMLLANEGTVPTEEIGYTRDALVLSISSEMEEDRVNEIVDVVSMNTTSRSMSIAGNLAQCDKELFARVLGMTPDGGKFNLDAPPEELSVALRLIMSRDDRSPVHLYWSSAKSNGSLELSLQRGAGAQIPFTFNKLAGTNSYLMFASAAETVAIATGVADRTQAAPGKYISWLKLSGESAAADALTDIAAKSGSGALTDGEVVRVQAASAAQVITVTHGSGTLETKDAANVVLNSTSWWIDFYYDATATAWKELARYVG